MKRFWQNLSVSRKLYCVVGLMALLIAAELIALYFAMSTLSAVRAFVSGEGLWSKAQKTAVIQLQRYALTRDERYFQRYLEQLRVPMGDHSARLAFESKAFFRAEAEAGLAQGLNHAQDIPSMVNLIRRFQGVPFLARAIRTWRDGDALIAELTVLGEGLRAEIQKGVASRPVVIARILDEIAVLDDRLTKTENEFSFGLGEASRSLESVLVIFLSLAVVTVESIGLLLTFSFARRLTSGLNDLNRVAIKVGGGDFSQQLQAQSQVSSADELGQLTESLNQMTQNLQRQISERRHAEHASEAKNLFLANMSHEIRTPLNAILGFSEILSDPELSPDERRHFSAIVRRTGASLTSIINDILDLTKVEAERLEVELKPFLLEQLIVDLETTMRLLCEEKGLDLRFRKRGVVAEAVESDPVRLRQILVNVIGNSIKFTDRGSVTVTYEVVRDQLVFSVEDTGAGIPEEQFGRLFLPFSQGDSSIRKKFGGTGLGLLVSQRLAQLLDGDVTLIRSIAGVGSLFSIRIAYRPALKKQFESAEPANTKDPSVIKLLVGKKILVVEDSLDNRLLAQVFLAKTGAEVEFASNGREGVDKAIANKFDLILMDIQMPVMDGYTATRELRNSGCQTPIVALTGFAMKDDRRKCLRAGCTSYLSKPFDRSALIACITSHF